MRAGSMRTGDSTAQALASSLRALGVETTYIGWRENARQIAAAVDSEGADAVELCVGDGGVLLLRDLLRELRTVGRGDVSIVVHRVD